jgi:hypothetical protein
MADLSMLIRDYCTLLDQERQLSERKERLRAAIASEMAGVTVVDYAIAARSRSPIPS